MPLSLLDIGYAAGFYDGEGSFWRKSDKGKYWNSCSVHILQKDPAPLVKLQSQFGGSVSPHMVNGRQYNRWSLSGVECRAFILTIFTLLSDRRRKQILKYKEFFVGPSTCSVGHLYVEGSYRITEGGSRRTCLICEEKMLSPRYRELSIAAYNLSQALGMTKEEAMEFLMTGGKNKSENENKETIQ
jgi:hypothetical protein